MFSLFEESFVFLLGMVFSILFTRKDKFPLFTLEFLFCSILLSIHYHLFHSLSTIFHLLIGFILLAKYGVSSLCWMICIVLQMKCLSFVNFYQNSFSLFKAPKLHSNKMFHWNLVLFIVWKCESNFSVCYQIVFTSQFIKFVDWNVLPSIFIFGKSWFFYICGQCLC